MDAYQERLRSQLRAAVQADEKTQQQLIETLANDPKGTLEALIVVLKDYEKPLLPLAVKAISKIGFPRNAAAIPALVEVASDQNVPGRWEAISTLKAMDVAVVVPFFLEVFLKRDVYWLLGTSVRKTRRFLRTDVPSSQYSKQAICSRPPGRILASQS
jgi:HEAT repeat protein